MTRAQFIAAGLVLIFGGSVGSAENWPGFRGPTGQGISTEENLPLHWDANSNLVWKAVLPGEGWSSPIVWGDAVFVTAALEGGTRCHVLRLDRDTGRVVWDREVFEQLPLRKEGRNSYATSTPCTDGQQVYAVFNDGSVAAVSFDGSLAWTNREVQFYSRHGLGASPILHDGLLIMPYDGSNRVTKPGVYPNCTDEERLGWQIPWDRSFIAALDTKTGRRVWTAKRGLSRIAHVTPTLLREGGTVQLISCAGNCIQGFDPKTGARVWTVESRGEGAVPGCAIGDGLIFTSSGFEATTLRTVRTGGQGNVTATHIAWEQRKGAPTLASLLYVRPFLHTITDAGIACCYKAETGEVLYQERVGGSFGTSPLWANGRVYLLSDSGETIVISDTDKFEILARNPLKERSQASLAASQGRLFIRTEKNLYCVGQGER